jgi:hypothetical protein
MNRPTDQKKPYVRPSVDDHGTVTDLTAVGQTNPGTDARDGSVHPQGLS